MGADIRSIGSATRRLDITKTLAGKEVLVTGVTGFLGKVWLSELLYRTPQIGRVHLLIRPSSSLSALERFEAIAGVDEPWLIGMNLIHFGYRGEH